MGQAIGQILALAVSVAISPVPIIASVLLLLTPHAAATGTAYVVGWLLGLIALRRDQPPDRTPSWSLQQRQSGDLGEPA